MSQNEPKKAVQIALDAPLDRDRAICKQCGNAYFIETKMIKVMPSMIIGEQKRLEAPGILVCAACLAPAILPWLTYGEYLAHVQKKEQANGDGTSGLGQGQDQAESQVGNGRVLSEPTGISSRHENDDEGRGISEETLPTKGHEKGH